MPRRLKVLISAYACEPGKGSEPEVGWQWTTRLARDHDVTVLTRANNAPALHAALANRTEPQPQFLFYDLPGWLLRHKGKALPTPLYYLFWQAAVRWRFRRVLRDFDLIHHLTFNSFRQPGFWWFTGRLVILGPLGGGQVCPWPFLRRFGRRLPGELLRSLSVQASRVYPHLLLSFGCARTILVANADTARRVPPCWRRKVRKLLETGISLDRIEPRPAASNAGGLKLLWVSRLEKIKAGELALMACAHAAREVPELQLTMVGSGPEESWLKQLASDLGVASRVQWLGKVPHVRVTELMRTGDVFLFTSVRDTSGNVLLEAMAAALPAITLRHHGAAEISTDDTAIRIPPSTPEHTAEKMGAAIVRLARSPEVRRSMGEQARRRVAEVFDWSAKVEQMSRFYRETVGD